VAGWVLAIDFGTTSTAAAMRVDDVVERIELDGAPRMPSMVFWREGTGGSSTGRLILGEEADELSGLAPLCLELTPKRRIGDEFMRLGEKRVRVTEVIAAILRKVTDEAMRLRAGEPPSEVRLTHPAGWASPSLEKLREAARIAGFDSPVFIPEPVAAAMHFASRRLRPGEHVAVYDLGGGTFDTAVLRRTEASFEVVGVPGGNEDLGGEDFDDRLFQHLGGQLPPEKWQALRESSDRPWIAANRDLRRQARRAKEFLSRSAQHEFYMAPPVDQELIARAETLRELIAPDIEATVAELERTIRSAGLDPTDLAAIYLAGGSSRIPLVARLIGQRLGQIPQSLDDPKAVIAMGAARMPAREMGGPGDDDTVTDEPGRRAAGAETVVDDPRLLDTLPANEEETKLAEPVVRPLPVPAPRRSRRVLVLVAGLAAALAAVAAVLALSGGGGPRRVVTLQRSTPAPHPAPPPVVAAVSSADANTLLSDFQQIWDAMDQPSAPPSFDDILSQNVAYSFTGTGESRTGRASVVAHFDNDLLKKAHNPALTFTAISVSPAPTGGGHTVAKGSWQSPELRNGRGTFTISFARPDPTDTGSRCATAACIASIVLSN
jgi:hypothetical protein